MTALLRRRVQGVLSPIIRHTRQLQERRLSKFPAHLITYYIHVCMLGNNTKCF